MPVGMGMGMRMGVSAATAVATALAVAMTETLATTLSLATALSLAATLSWAAVVFVLGTMGMGVGMGMSMSVTTALHAFAGCGIAQIGAHRRHRIVTRSFRYAQTAGGHAAGETLAEVAGEQHVHPVKRMRTFMELVHGHVLGQVQTVDLARLTVLADVIDEEAARAPGMRRDGAEVLAGNGDLHGDRLL